jgi:P27 family predicted phage terminase small subunit
MAKTGFTTGRKPQTHLIKATQSSYQAQPPEDLKDDGLKLWAAVFNRATWLDPELDGHLVAQAARFADDLKNARDEIAKSGRYVLIPNGSLIRSAAVVDVEKLTISLNAALSALGLTPTDRARLGQVIGAETDALTELERRRNARRIS